MGFSNRTPTIVTDGLVFAVDAGNGQSYVSASLDTFSLVPPPTGSLTGSLINSAEFDGINQGTWAFDGVNDYINFGITNSFLPFNGAMTVMGWFKSVASGVNQTIFTVRPAGGAKRWILQKDSNNDLYFVIRDLAGSPHYKEITSDTSLSISTWYHGCATWDGSNLNLYLNGISDATPVACSAFYYNVATNYTTLGAGWVTSPSAPTNDFNGNIASVKYYNKALTAAEVLQNYNATKGRFI